MNPMPNPPETPLDEFNELLERLMRQSRSLVSEPAEDTALSRLNREFLASNWASCHDGFLQRTTKVRIWPEASPAPRAFRFEIDTPFKRKLGLNAPVELVPGPIKGEIIYRSNLFEEDGPTVAVLIDRDLGYFHPNFNRERSLLCIGDQNDLPPGPLPLDQLIENHLYPILTYQNRRPSHPADIEAAKYFALDPTAMDGLETVEPLY